MDDEDTRTIWCGNLSEKVTEELLYELFLQAGPLQRVNIPKGKDGKQRAFGFVTYTHQCSVPYAMALFRGTQLFRRELNMKTRNANRPSMFQQPMNPVPDFRNNRGNHDGGHFRSHSAPVKINNEQVSAEHEQLNFDSLLMLSQQFMTAGSTAMHAGSGSRYSSEMGTSQYLGGNNKFRDNGLAARSLQGNWSSRNHPYNLNSRDSGHRRRADNRDYRHRY